MNKNYYEILGVTETADLKEIKKSYRSLAKKYHPDVSKESDAKEKFQEIQEAYNTLSDSEKRTNYDRLGHDRYKQSESTNGYGNYTDPGFSRVDIQFFKFSNLSLWKKILVILGIILFSIIIIFIGIVYLIIRLIFWIIKQIIGVFNGK